MTEAMGVAIVGGVVSIAGAYFAYRAKIIGQTNHVLMNSRMTELLDITKKASKAEGVLQEKTETDEKKETL